MLRFGLLELEGIGPSEDFGWQAVGVEIGLWRGICDYNIHIRICG